MKLIRAIIRPECEPRVLRALENIGVYALTKIPVTGRGRQGGAQSGGLSYLELAKVMILIALEDEQADAAVTTLAHAGYTGYPGDGRIFVSTIDKAVRLRTGEVETSETEVAARNGNGAGHPENGAGRGGRASR
jgi:nitrogen regulatory protein PII 1